MSDDMTNDERATQADVAVRAYAAAMGRGRPEDGVQLAMVGVEAAEAYAAATYRNRNDQVLRTPEHAEQVITDVLANLCHLADGQAAAKTVFVPGVFAVLRPTEDQAPRATAVLASAGPEVVVMAETAAAVLMAAAVTFDLDVHGLMDAALWIFGEEAEDERFAAVEQARASR